MIGVDQASGRIRLSACETSCAGLPVQDGAVIVAPASGAGIGFREPGRFVGTGSDRRRGRWTFRMNSRPRDQTVDLTRDHVLGFADLILTE